MIGALSTASGGLGLSHSQEFRLNLNEQSERVVSCSKAFYRKREPGHYLINVAIPVDAPAIPSLHDFDRDRQLAEWLDY